MRDILLQCSGVAAIVAALIHGVLSETKVFPRVTIEPPRLRTLFRFVWQVPTVAWIAGGTTHWSPVIVAILVYNCIVTTALGYFLWNKVLSMMPAAMAGQVMTLTPICGFVLSTIVFGGAVTADVLAAIGLIVAGIVITLRR